LLRVGRGAGAGDAHLEIVISLTSDGPVLRARAAAMEIDADTDLIARCDRFRVEARESISLVSEGILQTQGRRVDIEATQGSVRVRANDHVQLLGENVLLNCEPQPPMPAWAVPGESPAPAMTTVAVADASGDVELAAALMLKRSPP
ncbi:MAG TPA: hypothetical protein VNO55_31590, partial [Polyangia bacterium]|nr:hypothetical protein [Polyangia bacterium]